MKNFQFILFLFLLFENLTAENNCEISIKKLCTNLYQPHYQIISHENPLLADTICEVAQDDKATHINFTFYVSKVQLIYIYIHPACPIMVWVGPNSKAKIYFTNQYQFNLNFDLNYVFFEGSFKNENRLINLIHDFESEFGNPNLFTKNEPNSYRRGLSMESKDYFYKLDSCHTLLKNEFKSMQLESFIASQIDEYLKICYLFNKYHFLLTKTSILKNMAKYSSTLDECSKGFLRINSSSFHRYFDLALLYIWHENQKKNIQNESRYYNERVTIDYGIDEDTIDWKSDTSEFFSSQSWLPKKILDIELYFTNNRTLKEYLYAEEICFNMSKYITQDPSNVKEYIERFKDQYPSSRYIKTIDEKYKQTKESYVFKDFSDEFTKVNKDSVVNDLDFYFKNYEPEKLNYVLEKAYPDTGEVKLSDFKGKNVFLIKVDQIVSLKDVLLWKYLEKKYKKYSFIYAFEDMPEKDIVEIKNLQKLRVNLCTYHSRHIYHWYTFFNNNYSTIYLKDDKDNIYYNMKSEPLKSLMK